MVNGNSFQPKIAQPSRHLGDVWLETLFITSLKSTSNTRRGCIGNGYGYGAYLGLRVCYPFAIAFCKRPLIAWLRFRLCCVGWQVA